jgi:hypothetical protein
MGVDYVTVSSPVAAGNTRDVTGTPAVTNFGVLARDNDGLD